MASEPRGRRPAGARITAHFLRGAGKLCTEVGKACAVRAGGIRHSGGVFLRPAKTPNMKTTTKILAISLAFAGAAALSQAATASENWENLCAKCHGADGKGQTKVGKKLQIKDYTDAKVQAEMKDADMAKAISEGVTENGKEKMKAFKDLTPAEVTDLVAFVRKFKALRPSSGSAGKAPLAGGPQGGCTPSGPAESRGLAFPAAGSMARRNHPILFASLRVPSRLTE